MWILFSVIKPRLWCLLAPGRDPVLRGQDQQVGGVHGPGLGPGQDLQGDPDLRGDPGTVLMGGAIRRAIPPGHMRTMT